MTDISQKCTQDDLPEYQIHISLIDAERILATLDPAAVSVGIDKRLEYDIRIAKTVIRSALENAHGNRS
jgi:hypothetical protein